MGLKLAAACSLVIVARDLENEMSRRLLSRHAGRNFRREYRVSMFRKFVEIEQRPQIKLIWPYDFSSTLIRAQNPPTAQELWIEI
jgi:hypothetical protein